MSECLHWDHCDCDSCMAECAAAMTPTDPETPQTAAGRALLQALNGQFQEFLGGTPLSERAYILAIEAEARAARDAEVRALREGGRLILAYFEEAMEYIAENPTEDDRLTAYIRRADEWRAILSDTPETA